MNGDLLSHTYIYWRVNGIDSYVKIHMLALFKKWKMIDIKVLYRKADFRIERELIAHNESNELKLLSIGSWYPEATETEIEQSMIA